MTFIFKEDINQTIKISAGKEVEMWFLAFIILKFPKWMTWTHGSQGVGLHLQVSGWVECCFAPVQDLVPCLYLCFLILCVKQTDLGKYAQIPGAWHRVSWCLENISESMGGKLNEIQTSQDSCLSSGPPFLPNEVGKDANTCSVELVLQFLEGYVKEWFRDQQFFKLPF